MARPLRIQIPGGRYHLTTRGKERRPIFRDDQDRDRLLELFSELPERFGARVHAWVLMDNHYHLLLETPEANLSRAGQWVNLAYSVWFNHRHGRSGHLFQGRFRAVLVGDSAAWLEVARYAHLNPVRVARLGLSKGEQQRQRTAAARDPGAKQVAERLRVLRDYRWSSYRAYAGQTAAPDWLITEPLLNAVGGRSLAERRQAWREYHEEPLREGRLEDVWDRLVAGAVLGTESFVAGLKERWKRHSPEETRSAEMKRQVSWESIVAAVEAVHGEKWNDFRDRYGDWGRDLALYLGRRQGRLRLRELGELAGGIRYTAAAQAVNRVGKAVVREPVWKQRLDRAKAKLSKMNR